MGRKKDVLDRLAERLARGEISESTYLSIKERYEKNGFPDEDEEEPMRRRMMFRFNHHGFPPHLPPLVMGDFRGEEYCCEGVGKIHGNVRVGRGKVMGVCKIDGNFDGQEFLGTGTCKVDGNLNAEDLNNAGVLNVNGSIESKDLKTSGSLKVDGDVKTENLNNSGACKVDGGIQCKDKLLQSGALKVGGSVSANAFESTGSFRIGGALKAEKINIELSGESKVNSMEAPEITVKAMAGGGQLRSSIIKGNKVYLEATKADVVEGESVEIGPRCRIEKVIAEDLKAHETAKIEEQVLGKEETGKKK